MKRFHTTLAIVTMLALASTAWGQRAAESEEIVDGLKHPTSVAIQPETGDVFIAESGAKRIVRVDNGEIKEVIVDFPAGQYRVDNGDKEVGPLSMVFINNDTLVVGAGGLDKDQAVLRVFKIPSRDEDPIKAEDAEHKFTVEDLGDIDENSMLWAIAKKDNQLFFATAYNHEKGCIVKAKWSDGTFDEVRKMELRGEDAEEKTIIPMAVAISPENHVVVAKLRKGDNGERESVLAFFDRDGEYLSTFKTGLTHIASMAYDPIENRLFVVDVNWQRPDEGGLYILVGDGEDQARAERLTDLKRPLSIAFDRQGNMFVAVMGDETEAEEASGKVIMIRGLGATPGIPQDIN